MLSWTSTALSTEVRRLWLIGVLLQCGSLLPLNSDEVVKFAANCTSGRIECSAKVVGKSQGRLLHILAAKSVRAFRTALSFSGLPFICR